MVTLSKQSNPHKELAYVPSHGHAQTPSKPETTPAMVLSLESTGEWNWFYLWAHPKFANKLVGELTDEGATAVYVLERMRRDRVNGRGVRYPEVISRPLFRGCVFCHGTQAHRYVAQDSIARARTFDIRNQVRFRDQLAGVMLIAGHQVDLEKKPLAKGQAVKITSGFYAGFPGEVERDHNGRVWAHIEYMGRSVLMDVSRDEVEVTEGAVD
jgi:transcription antitermination factor NusG